jgi:hypothetical protein
MTDQEEKFHAHLDVCKRYREEPFNLCPAGVMLLNASGESMLIGLGQWNNVIRNSR